MITMKIDKFKGAFFDSEKVLREVDKTTRKSLSRFGAYVRQGSRQSIRKRKASSLPGQPPSSHTGLLKKFIFFAYDADTKSVVIGPALLGGKLGDVTEALEHGGTTMMTRRVRVRGRRERRRVRLQIKARPFMQPAFEAEKAKLPAHWRASVGF